MTTKCGFSQLQLSVQLEVFYLNNYQSTCFRVSLVPTDLGLLGTLSSSLVEE